MSGPVSIEAYLVSSEYKKRFRHRDASRDIDATPETISIAQLGWMEKTLADTMIYATYLTENAPINTTEDPAYWEPPKSRPPENVSIFTDDPRLNTTFMRTDMPERMAMRIANAKHLNRFCNKLHAELRHLGTRVGETLFDADSLPKDIQEKIQAYDKLIEEYQYLVDKAPKKDHANITQEALQAYNAQLKPVMDSLFDSLKTMERFPLPDGTSIPNQDILLNKALPESAPALALFALGWVGKSMIDRNKRPEMELKRLLDVVGVESAITDTVQELGAYVDLPAYGCDIRREVLRTLITEHQRDLQLGLTYYRIADCTYDKAYSDLELFLHMVGVPPQLEEPTPQERGLLNHVISCIKINLNMTANPEMPKAPSTLVHAVPLKHNEGICQNPPPNPPPSAL